jgi:hypothetical protein
MVEDQPQTLVAAAMSIQRLKRIKLERRRESSPGQSEC